MNETPDAEDAKDPGVPEPVAADIAGKLASPDLPASASGSVDIAESNPQLPASAAAASGSLDVAVSRSSNLPASDEAASGSLDVAVSSSSNPAVSDAGTASTHLPVARASGADLPASASGSVDAATSKTELAASASGSAATSKTELAASASGSVDVATSNAELAASASGSVDVATSSPALPASSSGSVDVKLSTPGIPEAVPGSDSQRFESQPVSSGRVVAAAMANEGTGPVGRGRRITSAMQNAVSGGVERIGSGIDRIGEGVTRVGDLTKKVPLVGASVGKLGESLSKAGESIHALPRVAQTRRGRLLVRSVVVGFLLVFSWIVVIVGFQLRSHDTPDFRPAAEKILIEISEGSGSIAEVYERASPRFHEMVRKEGFVDVMTDLNATNGKFREITAINETIVTRGPTGRVARVGLTLSYEKGIAKGSISFHLHKGTWKLLGVGVELPPDVRITELERQQRVAACINEKGRDVSDQRAKCPVRDAAETILEKIRDGQSGEVWDAASDVFKQQDSRAKFILIQGEHRAALGNYKRLLNVTEARSIGGLTATFDVVAEFDKASGVRVVFNFARPSKYDRWQLRSLKIVVPMPRADEDGDRTSLQPPPPEMPPEPPTEAGVDAN